MSERYANDARIDLDQRLSTAEAVKEIRTAIRSGAVRVSRTVIATGADRLDTIADKVYGDARYWWVLAAASNIGWGLQIPPGTVVNVVELNDIRGLY
jgi:nucleoid-associated protein YgaU